MLVFQNLRDSFDFSASVLFWPTASIVRYTGNCCCVPHIYDKFESNVMKHLLHFTQFIARKVVYICTKFALLRTFVLGHIRTL